MHFVDLLSQTLVYATFHCWQQNCCTYIASTSGCNIHKSEMPHADVLLPFTTLLKCLLVIRRAFTLCFDCIAKLFHNKIRISAAAYEIHSLGMFQLHCSWMACCITYILITGTGEPSGGFNLTGFSSLISRLGYSFCFLFGAPSNLEADWGDSNSDHDL